MNPQQLAARLRSWFAKLQSGGTNIDWIAVLPQWTPLHHLFDLRHDHIEAVFRLDDASARDAAWAGTLRKEATASAQRASRDALLTWGPFSLSAAFVAIAVANLQYRVDIPIFGHDIYLPIVLLFFFLLYSFSALAYVALYRRNPTDRMIYWLLCALDDVRRRSSETSAWPSPAIRRTCSARLARVARLAGNSFARRLSPKGHPRAKGRQIASEISQAYRGYSEWIIDPIDLTCNDLKSHLLSDLEYAVKSDWHRISRVPINTGRTSFALWRLLLAALPFGVLAVILTLLKPNAVVVTALVALAVPLSGLLSGAGTAAQLDLFSKSVESGTALTKRSGDQDENKVK